jgi:hypothetical protein
MRKPTQRAFESEVGVAHAVYGKPTPLSSHTSMFREFSKHPNEIHSSCMRSSRALSLGLLHLVNQILCYCRPVWKRPMSN